MKKVILLSFFCLAFIDLGYSQEIRGLDSSPLDLAVFRPDGRGTIPAARVIYSRPQKKGRTIFGDLVPHNKVWRTGANQTTEINLYRDMVFEGKTLKAGNYTLYTIPGEKEWTVIFNSNLHTWGAYDYDESKNVLKFKVPVNKSDSSREEFGIAFAGKDGKGKLLLAWDDTEAYINFTY